MSNYIFSVVMAVYNVEPFLAEAIDSIIAQDIGFEHIQLILVNDGSKDNSGAICDSYQKKYPDNIVVVHKENGGVSTARNAGLELVQGKYINFCDSDDKLSAKTLRLVKEFFDKHSAETDMAVIPLVFFDAMTGEHPLNSKFSQGTRVIDLRKEWMYPQLSFSCAFAKTECLKDLRFDSRLAYAEDAQLVQKILLNKQTLGVVAEACYHYRKRSTGEASAIQSSGKNPAWYFPYLTHFPEHTIAYCQETFGEIPLFVQNTLMYDLQWRFLQRHLPSALFTEEEADAYRQKLFALLAYIDDEVILAQRSLNAEYKVFLIQRKHPDAVPEARSADQVQFCLDRTPLCDFSQFRFLVNFITVSDGMAEIEGTYLVPLTALGSPQLYVVANQTRIAAETDPHEGIVYSVDTPIAVLKNFRVRVPLQDPNTSISFLLKYDSFEVCHQDIMMGPHSPITHKLDKSYCYLNGYLLTPAKTGFHMARCPKHRVIGAELALLAEIFLRTDKPAKRAFVSRILTHLARPFVPKNIWLISDKADRADDNGEAFFLYCVKNKEKANCYPIFAVGKHSADYQRLKQYGPVIPYLSWRYKLCHLLAKHTISAYSHNEITSPFFDYSYYYCDLLQRNKVVFLQHGIIKDDLSPSLNRKHKNYALFVTSTKPEYDSVLEYNYGYTDQQVILTGLPRYDRLYDNNQKKITIMPTWRRSLFDTYDPNTSQWSLLPGFEDSAFYCFYRDLLNSPKLHEAAQKYGYTLQFLIHPTLFPYLDRFHLDPRVCVLASDAVYRDVFAESSLIVTDYSSVAFDMAYLRKPVLYTHFDTNHYAEGYFSYEQDGFGEVEYDLESTVGRILEYMAQDCKLKDLYRQRIDRFFAFQDRNNCQRVYEKIMELDSKS